MNKHPMTDPAEKRYLFWGRIYLDHKSESLLLEMARASSLEVAASTNWD